MNKLNEGYQDLQNPDYPLYVDNPFNGEEVNNYAYGEDWYQEPKSNGIPYYMKSYLRKQKIWIKEV
jgi:hypothetical protein